MNPNGRALGKIQPIVGVQMAEGEELGSSPRRGWPLGTLSTQLYYPPKNPQALTFSSLGGVDV